MVLRCHSGFRTRPVGRWGGRYSTRQTTTHPTLTTRQGRRGSQRLTEHCGVRKGAVQVGMALYAMIYRGAAARSALESRDRQGAAALDTGAPEDRRWVRI